jgi:H+/gluconate symporter-like permease
MAVVANLLGLLFLIVVAYRGFSVILFAPLAAMIPILLTHPSSVPAIFTGLYMEKAVYFVKLYFPVFLLGAVFGKLIELSGFARSLVSVVIRFGGDKRTVMAIVLVSALLTYGGVSLFIVVFAVYPFAAEMFKQADIPKRLIPATLTLGAISFTMDALPGTPQIQNIIPTTFFNTTTWAAPWLGTIGAICIAVAGTAYLQWQVNRSAGEGYGLGHIHEPQPERTVSAVHPLIAVVPLIAVPTLNKIFGIVIPRVFGSVSTIPLPGLPSPLIVVIAPFVALWALQAALLIAILLVFALGFKNIKAFFVDGTKLAVNGALLATMNTASEFGFGAVIAALPGFLVVQKALGAIPNPLVNATVATTTLAGMTGSASGGLSIALAAMSNQFIAMARAAHIPLEVMHRVTAMASGGMDCLPHNGAIITLLAVCGLTHRQSYKDIFAITLIKTAGVFLVIAVYYLTGIV